MLWIDVVWAEMVSMGMALAMDYCRSRIVEVGLQRFTADGLSGNFLALEEC
jgi:hypothetical protein